MNENIDLVEILKDCPKGTELYSSTYGNVILSSVENKKEKFPIEVKKDGGIIFYIMGNGKYNDDGEIILFPSKEQRDWSKFEIPKPKKERFDPKTLQPFDKVLVRDLESDHWTCSFFSHIPNDGNKYNCHTILCLYLCCIPYNDETKHLVGTSYEAPEYYRYWED